jgi:hypothetical protein
MARTAVGPNNLKAQIWALDGDNQWTDPLEFRGGGSHGFSVLFEGTFTGTPVVQVRRPATAGIAAGAWVSVDIAAFTADTPEGASGLWHGSCDLRAGFLTLSGSAIVTLQA